MTPNVLHGVSLLTDHDIYLFKEGTHFRLYEKLGSHTMTVDGMEGTLFAVWAPNARKVSVIGDFNGWDRKAHPMSARLDGSGIWECFAPGVGQGTVYKYHITSRHHGRHLEKGDPFAFAWEVPPRSASVVWKLDHQWKDAAWMAGRADASSLDAPMSVYEMHLGSWKRHPDTWDSLSYQEMARQLPGYLTDMGFTHVEFLPVMEHPFYASWGYQTLGYFAPSSRYGTPQDFMDLVDALHAAGIGVILDWVPSHFPTDGHGLALFDGTHLYEHEDPRQGYHPDWKSGIFNYGRHEVRAFVISSALFWLDRYHADGLRVDAVASMLYLDYSRKEGEWVPNCFGGKENLEAIDLLRRLNEAAYTSFPGIQTIAEESTDWPLVSRPPYIGGLGFGMKWNMGWMHDTLNYFTKDPVFRKYHHGALSFSIWYAFNENFVLPLSHDEVVHGKGSLLRKMPGDDWQKFAGLRLLFGYMWTHPGKKLLFQGGEVAQWSEWNHDAQVDWALLGDPAHAGMRDWIRDLNALYRECPALHQTDFHHKGFEWVDFHDAEASVLSFLRFGKDPSEMLLACFNFTPIPREGYRVGVPRGGVWREVLNSDSRHYFGSGMGNAGAVTAQDEESHARTHTLTLTLPPLGVVVFRPE
ncbi:1,4-alpha-glucan branching enzyme GlgB [Fundidesulfovibrio magnetotacticus]|uniref:1,4-alpha-glucan branching enzyme GlgB n=1 Tax=Fundidesulfovibrio magnetotacticus TaxID=2730080 RepID=A0A6V8LTI8_9BACT|nr:1,4-alpha-glucan branching protein GlgB [Fundidesulfovibrio magnetotacticus]GFK93638.1 1,4-alpha-glucan branching enzyme GlgB [Fundidesulfovibrio magnetotacticus]